EHQPDRALFEQVRSVIGDGGLGTTISSDRKTEARRKEPGGGAGVADPQVEVVNAGEIHRIERAGSGHSLRKPPFSRWQCRAEAAPTSNRRRLPGRIAAGPGYARSADRRRR